MEFSKDISPQKNFVAISESYILVANRQKSRASENQKNAPRAILRILASVTSILLIEGILCSRQKKVSQLPFECSHFPFRIWERIPQAQKVPGQEGEQMLLGQAGMASDSPAYLDQLKVK